MYYLIWKVWECLIERFLFLYFVLFQLKNERISELHSYWDLWFWSKKANFEEQTNEIIKKTQTLSNDNTKFQKVFRFNKYNSNNF